jgi:hypothetical protein
MSKYLIAHIGHTIKDHEHITWWKPDSNGYTICIDKAGLYDESEARAICSYGACIAVSKFVAEQDARSTPYYRRQDGTLNKLYDGGPHRVVPNDAQVWKRLMSGRLARCAHPEKPTPISVKKARSVYIDAIATAEGTTP